MYYDEVIEDVWRNRDEYAQKHNNSLAEIVADLRRREKEHPERMASREHNRTRQIQRTLLSSRR